MEPSCDVDWVIDDEVAQWHCQWAYWTWIGKVCIGLSQETVLEIEYIFAVEPAKPEQKHPHNDW